MMELLTYTKRADFLKCPRYFFHRHQQGLEPIARRPGRWRGHVFGEALQAARDDQAASKWQATHVASRAALDVINAEYQRLEESGEWVQDQEDADDLAVEHQKMLVVVPAYINRYGLNPRREVEFHLPLYDPTTGGRSRTFDLAGKLDGMEIVGDKVARVIEDKLVGQIQKPMIERLPLDAQSSEYADALMAKGWRAEVSYRYTRWPGLNPAKGRVLKTKTVPAESLNQFAIRLQEDMRERRDWYFVETILSFPTEHMHDYRQGRWAVGRMIMDARVREVHKGWQAAWPMNPARCWEYGGCEFIPLCTKQDNAIDRYRITDDNQELSIRKDENATG